MTVFHKFSQFFIACHWISLFFIAFEPKYQRPQTSMLYVGLEYYFFLIFYLSFTNVHIVGASRIWICLARQRLIRLAAGGGFSSPGWSLSCHTTLISLSFSLLFLSYFSLTSSPGWSLSCHTTLISLSFSLTFVLGEEGEYRNVFLSHILTFATTCHNFLATDTQYLSLFEYCLREFESARPLMWGGPAQCRGGSSPPCHNPLMANLY